MIADNLIPLIIIEGPTASGKSVLALNLADKFGTEIISADSRQIYKYMNIGTAKPSKRQMAEIAHHLIDIITPDEEYSAGKFVRDAAKAIDYIYRQEAKDKLSRIPIIAGGTGFYVQALLEGLFEAPPVNEDIRQELDEFEREKGSEYLFNILEKLDKESAKNIHPNDSYRLKRALEIWIATGKGISEHWKEHSKSEKRYLPFRIYIGDDREALYKRINRRMERMVEIGLIEEIKGIMGKGYKPSDPGLTSVGYKEFIPFIESNAPFLSCLEEGKKNTRHYAKRQITWYKRIDFNLYLQSGDIDSHEVPEKIRKYFE